MSSRSLRIEHGGVRAWYALTSDCGDRIGGAAAAEWLNDEERVRHARFAEDDDRRMFLLGRVMARTLVGAAMNTPPTAWRWREGPHGRPEIADTSSDLAFNLAHSAGLVACAIASGREVGIDVEDLRRPRVDPALVRRYCSPSEVADIESHGDAWHDRFLHYWTLKEAYLKARGLGISVPLREIRFHLENHEEHEGHEGLSIRISFEGSLRGNDDRWAFLLTRPTDQHLVAVAVSTASGAAPRHTLERLMGLP
jgi:4'-phosphopantetheinyl transferase